MATVARAYALVGVIALLGLVAAVAPAGARVASQPTVEVQSVAGLAPDGRSIGVQVLASCPERWTVVEAVVTVSQPGASGRASFPLTCIGSVRSFAVTVPSAGGAFQLGEAQVTASVVINRGRTMRADDSQLVLVQPTVLVELAETARPESDGAAVVIDVTVACPAGTNGLLSAWSSHRAVGRSAAAPTCRSATGRATPSRCACKRLVACTRPGSRRRSRSPTSSTQVRTSTASTTTGRSTS
jgi:hypothetical protein